MEHIYNTLTVLYEKFKMVWFAFLMMKNFAVPAAWSRFPVKLIYCIAFRSASSVCCLLKSIAIFYSNY